MTEKVRNNNDLRHYLLGTLAEDARQRLEEELMTNNQSFEDLLIEEDELIDDFLRDNLSPTERQEFLETFLNTKERQRKLRFARTFQEYVQRNSSKAPLRGKLGWWKRLSVGLPAPSPALGYSIAAFLVLAVLGSTWLALNFRGRLGQVTSENARLYEAQQDLQQKLAEERTRRSELTSDLSREQRERQRLERETASLAQGSSTVRPVPTVASFLLTPGLLRSLGDTERVIVPAEVSLVQLQLDVGVDDYGSYRVALQDAEGDEIWTQSKLDAEKMPGKVVVAITLPATLLSHGDYSLRLSGITSGGDYELVARYYFRAIPQ